MIYRRIAGYGEQQQTVPVPDSRYRYRSRHPNNPKRLNSGHLLYRRTIHNCHLLNKTPEDGQLEYLLLPIRK